MKRMKIFSAAVMSALLMTSCYEDYIYDYNYSSAYFASQKPLRTVIADRDMTIDVGVAIGGKREVDMNDWAEFKIDETLLNGTGLTLLPKEYYTLSDPTTMRVSKSTLPVADVTVSFTEAFYADENAMKQHYALPFRVEASSLDSILVGQETSIVAIKYISTYHGTYYVKGTVTEVDANGNAIGEPEAYSNADLSKNITRNLTTISRNTLERQGLANLKTGVANEKVKIVFNDDKTLNVETADGGVAITNGSGSYGYDAEGVLSLSLSYTYGRTGKMYKVAETLIRRQDPLKDLRFEEWSIDNNGEGEGDNTGSSSSYIEYISDTELTASGFEGEYDATSNRGWIYFPDKTIPDEIFKNKQITFEYLGFYGIETIGKKAFAMNAVGTGVINELYFDEALKEIGNYAFENVTFSSDEILSIPNSVEKIGEGAFKKFINLTSVQFGNATLTNGTPDEANPHLKEIGKDCFNACQMLTGDVVIPSTVTKMNKAFSGKHKNLHLYFMSPTAPSDISGADNFNSSLGEISIFIHVPAGAEGSYTLWDNLWNATANTGVQLTEWGIN